MTMENQYRVIYSDEDLTDEELTWKDTILKDKTWALDYYNARNLEFGRMESWYFKRHYLSDIEDELEDEPTEETEHLTIVPIPTTVIDSVHGLLTDEEFDIRCLPSSGKRSQTKAQNTERFLHGTYWVNRQTQGGDPWEDAAQDALIYGWGCIYSYWDDERWKMSRDSKGRPKDLMDFYSYPIVVKRVNPRDIYPLLGGNRERWRGIIYAVKRPKSDIEEEWGTEILPCAVYSEEDENEVVFEELYDDTQLEYIDWWGWKRDLDTKEWGLWHSVIAHGQFMKKPTLMEEYELLPYEIFFCRKSPSDAGSLMGMSFLYPVIEPVQEIEYNMNRMSRILDQYADPAIVRVGALEGSDMVEKGPGTIFDVDIGGSVNYLTWAGGPPDNKFILDFWKELAQDAYPPVMTGMQGGFSGLDTIALQQGGKLKTNKPRRNLELAVQRVNGKIIRLLQQFALDDAVFVQGERSEEDEVVPFSFSIKGKDTQGFEHTIVTVKGRFPNEELRNVAVATQAVAGGIENQRDAMAKWMFKQNPERSYNMWLEEQMLKDPALMQFFMQMYMSLPTKSPVQQALEAPSPTATQASTPPVMPPSTPNMATSMAGGDIGTLATSNQQMQSAVQSTPVEQNAISGVLGGAPALAR